MKYLELADNQQRILPFYLAMEEYAASIIANDDIFFMWQVEPTVIFGRNQLIDNEVNLAYCKEHHIQVYRRKSGGGCVYADKGNIMFSYITKTDNVSFTFSAYTSAVARMLCKLGLNATADGRNDILIDGLKVSGNAFYHLPGRSIVHGTMLYDTDMTHMSRAITPSTAKLESKGVESVRQRITTINRHCDISLDDFKRFVRAELCDGTISLVAEDVAKIDGITQTYLTPAFIYGSNPQCNLSRKQRIPGVGEMELSLVLKHNIIKDINIAGDYFLIGNLDQGLLDRLKGVDFTPEATAAALSTIKVSDIIMNLSNEDLIKLLFQ